MGAYEDALASLSRTPIDVCVVTLDWCANTFGAAPCAATGVPCYNTFPTCRDPAHFTRTTRDYVFSSAGAPLPFGTGERPYLSEVDYLPTEIASVTQTTTSLTTAGRMKVYLADEPDNDIGIDPYVSERPSVQGTFLKKLLARNPNYKGRIVKAYKGFLGLPFSDYKLKGIGVIDSVTRGTSGGSGGSGDAATFCIECVDLLKDISNVSVPANVQCKLVVNVTAGDTQITVDDVTPLSASGGYVVTGSGDDQEVIQYASLNPDTNQMLGCTRGRFGTTATTHKADDKVQPCAYYPPTNPFTLAKSMLLEDAAIDPAYVDSDAFDFWASFLPCGEPPFSALIWKPTPLSTLYFEIMDLVDARSWIAENLMITVARNLPNLPLRPYRAISDDGNIMPGPAVDLNEGSRYTRVLMYWDAVPLADLTKPESYDRLDIAIDADAEGPNEYNEQVPYTFWCRWLAPGCGIPDDELQAFITNYVQRYLLTRKDASPLLEVDVEMKDYEISTGDFLQVGTDEMLNTDGSPIDAKFQVVSRDPSGGGGGSGNTIHLKLQRANGRICYIGTDDLPDYDLASPDQKEYGYICDDDGTIAGEPPYQIF